MTAVVETTTTESVTVPMIFDSEAMADWLAAQRNLTADDFLTAAFRVNRMEGPYLLARAINGGAFGKAEGFITWHDPILKEQAKATAEVWSACDNPSKLLSELCWTQIFSMIGYTIDGEFAARPPEPIRLYRGATDEGKAGFSWTTDLAIAKFFAVEYGKRAGDGKIWTATFMPEDLAAQINLREESEYVVIPEDGWDFAFIEEYDPAKHSTS